MKLSEYSESREAIKAIVNFGLSITLLSIVSVIKGAINSGSEFQYLDCLSISVTGFLIMFVSLFSNQEVFDEWKEGFRKHTRNQRFLFLGGPILLILVLIGMAWFLRDCKFMPNLSDLASFLGTYDIFPGTYDVFRIVFCILEFIFRSGINFVFYFWGSVLLSMVWISLSAYSYDFFYKKLLEDQGKKGKIND